MMVALAAAAALALIGVLLARVHFEVAWTAVIPSGAPVGAFIGDEIVVRPFSPADVSIRSGIFTAVTGRATPDKPFKFHTNGDDGYFIEIEGDRAASVELDRSIPDVPPFVIGILFWAAFALTVYASARLLPGGPRAPMADGRIIVGIWLASAALMYALTPHEFHNDSIGGDEWRNWGYLGFGYLDTMRAVGVAAAHHGLAGLIDVESMGKPIFYQTIVALLGGAWLPAFVPIVISCLAMGAAVAATYVIGKLLGGESVGWIAAGIFCVAPVVLQYAGAFYQESGYLAAACWALALTAHAVKTGSGRSLAFAAVLAAVAVSSKQILTAPLIGVTAILISLMMGAPRRQALAIGALQTAAAFAGFVALWPFLWKDTAYRMAFIWGQRIAFDAIVGVSHPIWQRFITTFVQGLGHCGPATLVLIALAVWAGFKRRQISARLCLAGIAIGFVFVVPTSLYLEHYLLFAFPFVPLAAGFGFDALRLSGPMRLQAGIAAIAIDLAWSAWFLPYPGAAFISCGDFACSNSRAGPFEPIYGLKPAAEWLSAHTRPGDVVAALASPHTLQADIPERTVLKLYFPPTLQEQDAALESLRPKYVVANPYSDFAGEGILTKHLRLVWTGSPRVGSPRVYESTNPPVINQDAFEPPPLDAISLLPPGTTRVIVTGHRDQFAAAFGDRQTVLPPDSDDEASFSNIIGLGGGVAVVGDDSPWRTSIAALAAPAAAGGGASAFILPTIESYRILSPVPMRALHRKGYAELNTRIPIVGSLAPFYDAVEVDFALAKPIAPTGHARVNISCVFGHGIDADVIWLGPSRMRALAPVQSGLLAGCVQGHAPLTVVTGVWTSSAKNSALPKFAAISAGFAWNAASADALAGAHRPVAVVAYGAANGLKTLWHGSDVFAFLRSARATALVVADSDMRFREFADHAIPLTDSTVLLEFSRARVPARVPASDV